MLPKENFDSKVKEVITNHRRTAKNSRREPQFNIYVFAKVSFIY